MTTGGEKIERWKDQARRDLHQRGVIDAHHHSLSQAQRRLRRTDWWDWLGESYWGSLAGASGVNPKRLFDPATPESERVGLLGTFVRRSRSTTYYRVAQRGIQAALGFDLNRLNSSNWKQLNRRIVQASVDQDASVRVLGGLMHQVDGVLDKHAGGTLADGITGGVFDWHDYIVNVRPLRDNRLIDGMTKVREIDSRFTKASVKIDSLFWGYLLCVKEELTRQFGIRPPPFRHLDGYLRYVDAILDQVAADVRLVALKSAIAGVRTLSFPATSADKARAIFSTRRRRPAQARDFENFLMHYLCAGAGARGLPFQIHVGHGIAGYVEDGQVRPGSLTNLVLEHPRTQFDLMHAGYPQWGECAILGRKFSNVFLNLSWCSMISDGDMRRLIDSWIDQLPSHKIMWGGDCVYVEETLGCFLLAREQWLDVLADKIARGWMSPTEALDYLHDVFRENARALFGLDGL